MRYRAGVIGCGRKGLTIDDERKCPINYCHGPAAHTRALEAMSEVDLVAVADTSPERRALAAERHPGVKIYESYEVMLADCDLDLVAIATQTPEHASATVAAARAGVGAIICEKAIATSMVEANEMIDTCARAEREADRRPPSSLPPHVRRRRSCNHQWKNRTAAGDRGDRRQWGNPQRFTLL